jgi:hypothetical protein
MTPPDPQWTAFLTAMLTPVVAALGVYFAYRQARVARSKLTFDLFEPRRAIYRRAVSLATAGGLRGEVSDEVIDEVVAARGEAHWILDDQLAKYLATLIEKAGEMQALVEDINAAPAGSDRQKELQKRRRESRQWFRDQLPVIGQQFARFMRIQF